MRRAGTRSRRTRRRSFSRSLAQQGLLDLVADSMRDSEVDLLDHWRVVARRHQQMVAQRPEWLALAAGKAHGDKTALPGSRQRRQHDQCKSIDDKYKHTVSYMNE